MLTPKQALMWFDRTRELSKLKQHKPQVKEIIKQTQYLPTNSSLPQRLHHIITEIKTLPTCKLCNSPVSWDRRYRRYKTYCGKKVCVSSDPDIVAIKKQNTNYKESVDKRRATNLNRYGVTNYLASPSAIAHNKTLPSSTGNLTKDQHLQRANVRSNTLIDLYGVSNFSHTLLKLGVLDKLLDKSWLYDQHYVQQKSLTQIAHELEIRGGATTIGQYLRRHNLDTQTQPARSHGEKQISNMLSDHNIDHNVSDRNIIGPLEIDIYIPSHNIAIEYCGLYWHSEQQGKTRQYHKLKYDRCAEKNIQLLTIFEDEWGLHKTQVIKKILSLLSNSKEPVVYGRQTQIVNLDIKQKNDFFNANHLQGTGSGSITHGLVYENEIVAAMTWIKSGTIFTLNRYATSARVIGGFSKLLSHFQKTHKWMTLVSFADLRWSKGNLYQQTGWKLDKILPPDYYYSPDGHKRIHKFNYRRKYLPKLLKTFDSHLSEVENCKNNNILRIWDCGKHRYVITNPDT
jgi:hypothetical protein